MYIALNMFHIGIHFHVGQFDPPYTPTGGANPILVLQKTNTHGRHVIHSIMILCHISLGALE